MNHYLHTLMQKNREMMNLLMLVMVICICQCSRKVATVSTLPQKKQTEIKSPSEASKIPEKKLLQPALHQDSGLVVLSPASKLLIATCDNYLTVNPESPKAIEVYTIKASIYYNNRLYDSARAVYSVILGKYSGTSYASEAVRMTAQSYYEERRFDQAGIWYQKLSDVSSDSTDRKEARARIAESIFRMAELSESENRFETAAKEYERISIEYPESKIADVALFNAGLSYEKMAEWSRGIIVFQKLLVKYPQSKLVVKSEFRIGKCHEKMQQWDAAAGAFLGVAVKYPEDELASVAMYNAGFNFENAGKLKEAAATFEKMASVFAVNEDAADVLFRAGELYGKIKDWDGVARVTGIFTKRFGNDENRIVQALCMSGIAQYMRNRLDDAVRELTNAVQVYKKLKEPGSLNAYYAAKASFTLGEIYQGLMVAVTLGSQDRDYKRKLAEKSDLLDKCIENFAGVIKFNLSDWTTRSVYQIGQAYEDFAIGIFSQERPAGLSIDKRMSLELGIAQAVEKYFIEKALTFHVRNVKLGIQEKLEDKYVLQSRQKLTYLPYVAAENYLAIVEIARSMESGSTLDGFALIARKLDLFQKIAPFQKRAIELYLECLELASTYQEYNENFTKASAAITGLSLSVGSTYAEVVNIARNAPIPGTFDPYEAFVYKTKLLRQIETYEDQALENYLKTIKIADAYKLTDTSVGKARELIAELLFNRGRCYDLLCVNAFSKPPYPAGANEAEQEEYRGRFEEIGLKFQEQAFDIYKSIIDFAEKKYASGTYVTHAYIRLYQNFPDRYGVKEQQMVQTVIGSGSQWKIADDAPADWFTFAVPDSSWVPASRSPVPTLRLQGFPGNAPIPMWTGESEIKQPDSAGKTVFLRRTFDLKVMPHSAVLYLAAEGITSVYVNADRVRADTMLTFADKADTINLMGKLRVGSNLVAIKVQAKNMEGFAVYPMIIHTIGTNVPLPKPPGYEKPLTKEETAADKYVFPVVTNFTIN